MRWDNLIRSFHNFGGYECAQQRISATYTRVVPGPKATKDSIAFQRGVWVAEGSSNPRSKTYLAETSDKEFRYIKVADNITSGDKSYAWLAPLNNPQEVAAVLIDHFLFVESGKAQLKEQAVLNHFKSVPSEKIYVLDPGYYFLNQKVFSEFDNNLKRGVLRVVSNCSDWAIQTQLADLAKRGGKWDLYVSAKAVPGLKATAQSVAFNGGCVVSSSNTKRRDVLLSETEPDKFKLIKLAEDLTLTDKSYMFMAPKNNPAEVKNIWIDKVILVQQD